MRLSVVSKIIVTSALLATTTVALARNHHHPIAYKADYKNEVPCPVPPTLLDGFYVGAQAGYDSYRVRQTLTGPDFGSFSAIGSLTGWMGGLFVGYGGYIDNFFYLGGEILGNYDGNNQTTLQATVPTGDSVAQQLKAKATWGLALIPGVRLNEAALGYIRVGYDWTNFEATDTATVVVPAAAAGTFSGSNTSTQGGWDFGIGIETLFACNWSFRTEFNHIWYNSFSLGTHVTTERFEPSDNQFTVGVVYHIG